MSHVNSTSSRRAASHAACINHVTAKVNVTQTTQKKPVRASNRLSLHLRTHKSTTETRFRIHSRALTPLLLPNYPTTSDVCICSGRLPRSPPSGGRADTVIAPAPRSGTCHAAFKEPRVTLTDRSACRTRGSTRGSPSAFPGYGGWVGVR